MLQALKSSLKQDICFDLSHKKTQITLLAKKQNLHLVTILQPTIKLAFTPIDLSAQRRLILFKPKVRYQTRQKWLKMLIKPNQRASLSVTKNGNLNTTALALAFYCIFVSNGVRI